MFIRSQKKGETIYWFLIKSYRKEGKVKQVIQSLGKYPSIMNLNGGKLPLTQEEKEVIYNKTPILAKEYENFKRIREEEKSCSGYLCKEKAEFWNAYTPDKQGWCKKHWTRKGKKQDKHWKEQGEFYEERAKQDRAEREIVLTAENMPFKVLGIKKEGTPEEIKTRYRELSKLLHPDTGGDSKLFAFVTQMYDLAITQSGSVKD